jgi:hypothetical protein
MRKVLPDQSQSLYDKLFKKEWVVYAKRPFGRPEDIVEYLGRYSHKIAISNHRIRSIDKEKRTVTISLKDYRNGGKKTVLSLSAREFIRRYSMHILPKGFTRIRHYGILSSGWKKEKLPKLQATLGHQEAETKEEEISHLHRCPVCKKGTLETLVCFDSRGPPADYAQTLSSTKLYNILKDSQ